MVLKLQKELKLKPPPIWWKEPCANFESTLHQLSPYIGKIKSSIAGDLIEKYTNPGELVIDPFSGAGTIPLEALIRGRRIFAADISPYSKILSQAKLSPPKNLKMGLDHVENVLKEAEYLDQPDLRSIPLWVRQFFHPETLRSAIRFATIGRKPGNEFPMACFLGILHHQRPGFLSYPSSHLVPYLRYKKYPPKSFPEMYAYRELRPRLLAKVYRTFKRFPEIHGEDGIFKQCSVEKLRMPNRFDAVITSPPYMNALDYMRDNRLRLWFIDPRISSFKNMDSTRRQQVFIDATKILAEKIKKGLKAGGYCIFIVGEEVARSNRARNHPSEVALEILTQQIPTLSLRQIITDNIPDVRRTRRDCRGVKTEHFLILQRK